MSDELGPLAGLEGIWEGEKGTDTAPDDAASVRMASSRGTFTKEI